MSKHRIDKHLVSLTSPGSFAAEQYQGLRLTLERLRRAHSAQVIAVTSPGAGEGKTLTAINLAAALARGSDARVLLVDADLRRPAVARQLGIVDADAPGLADLIARPDLAIGQVAHTIEPFNLSVIRAGSVKTSVHHVLRSPRLDEILKDARARFDFIVVDTPPLLPVFDSALVSRTVDGVLVVIAANQTPRKLLGEALNLLDASKVLGIVFNRDARPLFGYYDSYYREYFPDTSGLASRA
ncbi:MAG TPA: CpsD/CapB family tyrosine-protein kinase [Vicinamibacterales bacterium]